MNNNDLYINLINLLRNENIKSNIYRDGNIFRVVRYKTDNKKINYSAKTLKELSEIIFNDFNII